MVSIPQVVAGFVSVSGGFVAVGVSIYRRYSARSTGNEHVNKKEVRSFNTSDYAKV